MSIRIKVYKGTPVGENLCESCERLRVIKGHRGSDEMRKCSALEDPIRFSVAECSYFKAKEAKIPGGALVLHFDRQHQKLMIDVDPSPFSVNLISIDEYRGVKKSSSEDEQDTEETVQ